MTAKDLIRQEAFKDAAEQCRAFRDILGNSKDLKYIQGAHDCADLLAKRFDKVAEDHVKKTSDFLMGGWR